MRILAAVFLTTDEKIPSGHESVRAPCGSDVSPYFSVDLPAPEGRAHRLVTARKDLQKNCSNETALIVGSI
jgi:hypothetical protein